MGVFVISVIYLGCGVVYLTPGVLPVAAVPAVKWSRYAVGAGMLIAGVALAEAWWHGTTVPALLQLGMALVGAGLASTLVTILRQPCAPKA
jgi:hypothetical protein